MDDSRIRTTFASLQDNRRNMITNFRGIFWTGVGHQFLTLFLQNNEFVFISAALNTKL